MDSSARGGLLACREMESPRVPSGVVELRFDNRFVRELPADPDRVNRPRQVHGACYSWVEPAKVRRPEVLAYSREMADALGISEAVRRSEDFAQVFSGNRQLPGARTYATCYGGNQFGQWAGQLGDGRAINLGEAEGREGAHWTLQLKGAGPTPYSRTADGLAVLRSSIREFLCSEAMHHLGVPTTRALSLLLTGEQVERDMLYDGHPKFEPGAIVCRASPSFTRFGSFEIFASRNEIGVLKSLADFTIRTDYPHLIDGTVEPEAETYVRWFEEICRRTAEMIVHWTRVGFVHGVMNTDNMSILGLTIDYGPYGWLEDYDPNWTPNTTDAGGRRYRFGHQPQVALWNLVQLARALLPLIGDPEPLEQALDSYREAWEKGRRSMMASKLGLSGMDGGAVDGEDGSLFEELTKILAVVETDMTIFFRRLADLPVEAVFERAGALSVIETLADAYYLPEQLDSDYRERLEAWIGRYRRRVLASGTSDEERREWMNAVNPKYVLRNYLAQLAIDKAEAGDPALVEELLDLLRRPYDEQPEREEYAAKRPDWARDRPGCSMLSCSS